MSLYSVSNYGNIKILSYGISFIPRHFNSLAENSYRKSVLFLSFIETEVSELGAQLAWLFLQMEKQIITRDYSALSRLYYSFSEASFGDTGRLYSWLHVTFSTSTSDKCTKLDGINLDVGHFQ